MLLGFVLLVLLWANADAQAPTYSPYGEPITASTAPCYCQNNPFQILSVDAAAYQLTGDSPLESLYSLSSAGVLTSGDKSAYLTSEIEDVYQSSRCYPVSANCPGTPTTQFVFDYSLSRGAFKSGDGAFNDLGFLSIWDSTGATLVTSAGVQNGGCTNNTCNFRQNTSTYELNREIYVNSKDTTSPYSWARVLDSYSNTVGTTQTLRFVWTHNFGCGRIGGSCLSVDCSSLGGGEASLTEELLPTRWRSCARSIIRADTKGSSPLVGVVFQGTPPEAYADSDPEATVVAAEDNGATVFSSTVIVPPRSTVSFMWFAIQTNPHDVSTMGEVVSNIFDQDRAFFAGSDTAHPFYGVSRREWTTIQNWNSGATVAPLVVLLVSSFLFLF